MADKSWVALVALVLAACSGGTDERELSIDSRAQAATTTTTMTVPVDVADGPADPPALPAESDARSAGARAGAPAPVAAGPQPEGTQPGPAAAPTTVPPVTTTTATPPAATPHEWIGQECRLSVDEYTPEPPCGDWAVGECPPDAYGMIVSRWTDITESWSCSGG